MDYKKVIWAYMIKNGHRTNGLWSYYGGDWEHELDASDYRVVAAGEKDMRSKIKYIGVDWTKTRDPVGSVEAEFTDTFHDSNRVQTLLGTIYLKDGTEYLVGCKDVTEDIAGYVNMYRRIEQDEKLINDVFDNTDFN